MTDTADDYVAWCRYFANSEGELPTAIFLCNSDAPGAFKVYRVPPMHDEAKAILQKACDRDWKDETLYQTANIVSNAIYWRNRKILYLEERIKTMRSGGAAKTCAHEWYQGRCVHCDIAAINGKADEKFGWEEV